MNQLFNSTVPVWVSILFLLAIPIPVFLISVLGIKGGKLVDKPKIGSVITVFYIFYFTYVTVLCFMGVFKAVTLPPKILQVSTLPLLLLLVVVLFNLPITKKIIDALPLEDLVQIHIFRLIGSFFIILALFNTLPKTFSFIAGCGDVITAVSSIWVAKLIKSGKTSWKLVTYVWNTFGFIDILFTATMAFILTKISIETGVLGVEMLAEFPFCFIPAFAPPTIIFLHLCIYRKLISKKN